MPCHPEPCLVALPAKVDSPVEAGEVADEVRQKGGAPAEGAQKTCQTKGCALARASQGVFSANVMHSFG